MRTFKVSDAMYEQLKDFVVDPFDDTPEVVIGRLIEIVNKAKSRWLPFNVCDGSEDVQPQPSRILHAEPRPFEEQDSVVML